MIPGRSKKVFKTWLASRPDTWRERIEIVAMDGFTGFKSTAAEELPGARAVMDPFHVVHLAGDALNECRRRVQQELHHRRGGATAPLYKARRMLTHPLMPAHPTPATPASRPVRRRLPRRTRSHLERLPEHHQRLPRARHEDGQGPDASRNQHTDFHACAEEPDRTHHAGQNTQTPSRGHPGLLRPPAHQQRSHRSHQRPPRTPTRIRTRTCETSPATSPEHSSKQEDSTPTTLPNMKSPKT